MEPDEVQTVRIRGLAERAASPVHRIGPAVTIPETLPVLLEFSRSEPSVGTATLHRDDEGIHADATLYLTGRFGEIAKREDIRKLWPKFAIGFIPAGDLDGKLEALADQLVTEIAEAAT